MTGGLPQGGATARGSDVDRYHGVDVPDPYRWLEVGDAPEVQTWVSEQNLVTRTALDALPSRRRWHNRVCTFLSRPVVQAVQCRDDTLILLERAEGEQQAKLVARSATDPDAHPIVLVDPADAVSDAAAAVDWYAASDDGALVAFGVSEGGTENSVLRIVRVEDGSLLDIRIPDCRASSVAWEPDGSGFFYTRYPAGDQYNRTVHHHTIGADGTDDPVVWAQHPSPQTWPNVSTSPDGRWLMVQSSVGWSRTDVQLLDRRSGVWTDVITGVDAITWLVFADDSSLVGATTLGAPRGRVVRIDLGGPDVGPDAWVEVVAERDGVVSHVRPEADELIVAVSSDGVDSIERWSMDGRRVPRSTGSVSVRSSRS